MKLNKKVNLLLGVSGSIATIKLEDIIIKLLDQNNLINIRVIFTEKSKVFSNLKELK